MTRIDVAANRGDIGGGELMQLRLATALAELHHDVRIVAPSEPGDVADAARDLGLDVDVVACRDRASYARALRRRDRRRTGLLWCNGLLPALATAGRPRRVVHLHQLPVGSQQPLAALARLGARATVVPSAYLQRHVRGAQLLSNWTEDLDLLPATPDRELVIVGFLGRIGREKGTDVLAEAVRMLPDRTRSRVRLLVAGDDRFVPAEDRRVLARALANAGVAVDRPGWIDARRFFAEVDVAVVPSVRPESFGLVAAEAMAAGRPVVVSDAGALPEVVGPGHPWVAARGSAASLARGLAAAIEALPGDVVVKGQRRRWESEYSPEAGRRHLAELLDRMGLAGLRT